MIKLWNRNFNLLVAGQMFSVFANSILQFTLSLYVLDLTGSAAVFATITVLSIIPRVICLPFGGILADRSNKKRVMIALDASYALMTVVLGLALLYKESIFFIGIIAILLGVVSAFETPVVQSCIPSIQAKQHLEQSNGIVSAIAMLSNLLGPVLAGILYAVFKAPYIFIGCCLIFIIAIVFESFLVVPFEKNNIGKGIGEILRHDFRELKKYLESEQPVIIQISLVAAILNMLIFSFIVVGIPYIVRIQLSVSSELYGIMQTLFAVGGLVGSISIGAISRKIAPDKLHHLLLTGTVLFASLVVPFITHMSNLSAFWFIAVIATIIQAVFAVFTVYMITVIQKITTPYMLGRVMSMVLMLSTFALPVGQVLYGLLLENYLSRIALIILTISVICLVIAVISRMTFSKLKLHFEMFIDRNQEEL